MTLRIAGLSVLSPADTLDGARSLAGWATGLPRRVGRLLDDAEGLVARISAVVDRAEAVLARTEQVVATATGAAQNAQAVADTAKDLLDTYAPIAVRGAPLARQFVEEFSELEVHAAVQLVDMLPAVYSYMQNDVLPILATLDRVGPDIHELLEVSKDVKQAVTGIPGFRFFGRRGERLEEEAAERDDR
ncbi:MAG TPA: ribulose 1,5-bisphosphate carboxylase large subunit [Mycobacteriales bacterium]|nr:ribulose 1,5-bisphosphate carboxylase large subunit [Mycobacteriales bacterium]